MYINEINNYSKTNNNSDTLGTKPFNPNTGFIFKDRNLRIYLQINFDSLQSGIIISAALWHHTTAAWSRNVEVVDPPIMVHGMGLCLRNGSGLPYASLGSVTVSTGEFHALPVYGVVVSGDLICYG